MADRIDPRHAIHADVVKAGNLLGDMLDFLAVVGRAILIEDEDSIPDTELATVLRYVLDMGAEARGAAQRAAEAISTEMAHG